MDACPQQLEGSLDSASPFYGVVGMDEFLNRSDNALATSSPADLGRPDHLATHQPAIGITDDFRLCHFDFSWLCS